MPYTPDMLEPATRAAWMRILALAPYAALEARAAAYADVPYALRRGPETGLVMLRGRMGSTGGAFNLGEASVTRCTVRLAEGPEGHAYVLGRNAAHARLAAVCDALLQLPARHGEIHAAVIAPLAAEMERARVAEAAKAAATKVDFFTMVRGDD